MSRLVRANWALRNLADERRLTQQVQVQVHPLLWVYVLRSLYNLISLSQKKKEVDFLMVAYCAIPAGKHMYIIVQRDTFEFYNSWITRIH